ncbi:MAG: amidase [Actinomycetota bacterium]|nr:amidase [Actinomycetota bacterium]
MTDLARMSAVDLVRAYADGAISPVEAARVALDAIATYDDHVNAFLRVDETGALDSAKQSEERWRSGHPVGPADGVPTSIKDIFLTAGWPTLRGSHLVDENAEWRDDAPAVARLREAGTVFLGKTTTPEFAWKGVTDSPRFGVTGNAWAANLTAGGSSGGSATAVALGMGTWSIGTDGGGSVRIPASFTGTVAMKPTYGVVPHWPASPFGTLAHAGPMTRSVRDCAFLLDTIYGFDARDWSAMPTPGSSFLQGLDDGVSGLRIAFSPTLGFGENAPEVEALVRTAVGVLADAGAEIEEVDPGIDNPEEAFKVLWFAGAAKVLEQYDDTALERVDPGLRAAVEEGRTHSALDYLGAVAVRMDLGLRMGRLHENYDLLLTPTMPIVAFPAGQDAPDGWPSQLWTSWTPYTYLFNMTQQPALSVPCGFTEAGLPVGLQVVGPRHRDALVLRAGQAYEQATAWSDAVPTLVTRRLTGGAS